MSSLQFVVTNAPELDFDLVQEAWLNDRLIATIKNVAGKWKVIFFPKGQYCELAWEYLVEIQRSFEHFIHEHRV